MSRPVLAKNVEPEKVEFLWKNSIPKGMLTVVAGRPDQGKGLFAAHVAAEVSAAGGKVLYSAAEDSHGLMTRPRLEAAGANLDNILLWRFQLPSQAAELAQIVVEEDIALIVMDPFASHLSGGVSRHSDNVRSVLGPLTTLIESTGTAVLIVEHALKNVPKNGHPLNAIGGSGSGLPAAARAAFVFGKDPADEDKRILAPVKFNIGDAPNALAFEIDVDDIAVVGDVPLLIEDQELMAFDPMRLFESAAKSTAKIGRPPDKRAAAAEWVTQYLAKAGGPVKSGTVQEDAKQYGMSAKTLRRAADDMGIVRNPPGGGRNCTWDLPDDVKDLMGIKKTKTTDVSSDVDTSDLDDGLAALLGGSDA